ncbi:N-acetylmuramoyl-L-alanine amidase [Jatrophihabitans sp. GAS493]|uniref:N-acetylmuramoyl-L-alanine amidase n=1 Tax=Jatrophihabitans sp. GAS493 TaxID=1907575 RepID=UPI0018D5A5FE|nr:N-acetylmuramoyl-L-alanine amidase [Jatrophihabitans sp. GAS493]
MPPSATSHPAHRPFTAAALFGVVIVVAGALGGCSAGHKSAQPAALSQLPSPSATPASTPVPTPIPTPIATMTPAPTAKPTPKPTATPRAATPRPVVATSPPVGGAVPLPNVAGSPLVVLNPGHNGGDAANLAALRRQVPAGFGEMKDCETTGTNTNAGYPEHAFNWDVSTRVAALLRSHGVRVTMTRPNDDSFGPCVDQRAAIGNQPGVAAVISIHADGAPVSGHGFHVCQDSRQPAGAAVAAQSSALTKALHDSLLAGSGMTVSSYLGKNGYYPRDDLAGLNLALKPATFLEIGNMRNAGDAAIQTSAAGRQRIAVAVASGILAYLSR